MERIAEPLRQMGAQVETTDGHAPMTVHGGAPLQPVSYALPVASAQVKSCVLLAGLYAGDGPTVVVEHGAQTRDHTERLLRMQGARVQSSPRQASVWPVERLSPLSIDVPGDFSSAAPLDRRRDAARGLRAPHPRREPESDAHRAARRPRADGRAHRRLQPADSGGGAGGRSRGARGGADGDHDRRPEEVPRLIDELPLFALAAGMAHGESRVEGAQELRAKESNRIETVTTSLKAPWHPRSRRVTMASG